MVNHVRACGESDFLQKFNIIDIKACGYDVALGAFGFFTFVYLCMIAFGIGEELHISRLKTVGKNALVISLIHMAVTFALTSGGLILFGLDTLDALLVGSIGVTSAPAITFVLMNQMRIEGHLRRMAGGVLVITDLIGVLAFSILVQLGMRAKKATSAGVEDFGALGVFWPVGKEFVLAIAIGVAMFLALKFLVHGQAQERPGEHKPQKRSFLKNMLAARPSPSVELLLITIAIIAVGTGSAYKLHLPFLVTAIVAGFLVANFHTFAVFDSLKIGNIAAMFNLGFFAMVGATMNL